MDGRYQQAIGMAIECRRLDKLEEGITKSDNVHATLSYCLNVSHSFVNRREYRREVKYIFVLVSMHLLSFRNHSTFLSPSHCNVLIAYAQYVSLQFFAI